MKRAIEIDADFFEHLLNCMANQKYLGSQLPEEADKNQKVIDEAWRKGMDILNPIKKKLGLVEEILNKFNEKLNNDFPIIAKKIKDVMDDSKYPRDYYVEYALKWSLVRQECEMYCLIAENIEKKEFDLLCKRRGFTKGMRNYIIEMMKHVGLGENLEI